eukprot:3398577-Pyramimonas_sp.AAC.1
MPGRCPSRGATAKNQRTYHVHSPEGTMHFPRPLLVRAPHTDSDTDHSFQGAQQLRGHHAHLE